MFRRTIIAACVLLFLVLVLAALWSAFDWPPPGLILKYGFPSAGGPTGRTMTIEGLEFVELKPGYFRMGSHFLCQKGDLLGGGCALLGLPWGKQPRHRFECPRRWIDIGQPLWIATTEVTNQQYEEFEPSHKPNRRSAGRQEPVVVTWEEAERYCRWLSHRGSLRVLLPSEAQWEYACRAGSTGEFSFGDDSAELGHYAWYGADEGAHEVATRRPNAWGLFDLHGNVWELCADALHWSYDGAPAREEPWLEAGVTIEARFLHSKRGGDWFSGASDCRSASRSADLDLTDPGTGFRPVARPR